MWSCACIKPFVLTHLWVLLQTRSLRIWDHHFPPLRKKDCTTTSQLSTSSLDTWHYISVQPNIHENGPIKMRNKEYDKSICRTRSTFNHNWELRSTSSKIKGTFPFKMSCAFDEQKWHHIRNITFGKKQHHASNIRMMTRVFLPASSGSCSQPWEKNATGFSPVAVDHLLRGLLCVAQPRRVVQLFTFGTRSPDGKRTQYVRWYLHTQTHKLRRV